VCFRLDRREVGAVLCSFKVWSSLVNPMRRIFSAVHRAQAAVGLACALTAVAAPAVAQIGSDRYSSVVIEESTGKVISAVSPDEPRYPASLTKMMTLYMVFEALRDRRVTLSTPVVMSAHAAAMMPSKLGVPAGRTITVEEAILGLVTKSANDAAAAVGEMLGGDEERFAQMMTLRARGLSLTHTTFRNASGLPDPDQVTTARDLAVLGRRLIEDFPVQYRYFSVPSFRFRGRTIMNHDRMLTSYPGADGIKTGYIEASGHNLVTSAARGDVRLVGVVLGAASNGERDSHMAALLNAAFDRLDVPLAARHDAPLASHMPSLVSSVQAATLTPIARTDTGRAGEPLRASARVTGAPPSRWAIQVGTYASQSAARQAATAAARRSYGGEPRVSPVQQSGRGKATMWRAQVVGLSQAEAQAACAAIVRKHGACLMLRPDQGQFASR